MSAAPETKVLSQALEAAIGEARVRTAVFVAYAFDPAFFEHSILPSLFARGFSDNEGVRRAQLDESLRGLDHLAVYYDRSKLISQSGSARLDYRRIGVSTRRGVLHAKHVFLLLEDPGDPPEQRLVMLTTSANLTRSGWWENVEVGHVHEIHANSKDLLRDDLLGAGGFFAQLQRLDRTTAAGEDRHGPDATHAGLEQLRDFLKRQTDTRKQRSHGGQLFTRLWHGESPLPEYLGGCVPAGCRLEVISPFFDNQDDTPTLKALIEAIQPTKTRILLPRDELGRAQCSKEFYEAVKDLPNVDWSQLPKCFTSFAKGTAGARQRYVHAKIYRIFSPKDRIEMMLVGSPNLTGAAHRGARQGNLETAVLLDLKPSQKPAWWMDAIDDAVPVQFHAQPPEDETLASIFPVTLRFDWKSGTLQYFWEQRRTNNPSAFRITSGGQPVAEVGTVKFDAWTDVLAEADLLRSVLRSNSFLDVSVADLLGQRVLVQETRMEGKPSLLRELSPEQILEFWSMLTTDQQDAFLEEQLTKLVSQATDAEDLATAQDPQMTSMFDRFAGIFHAFSCLQERLDEALESGDASGERHAKYRLFGERGDSLGALIDKQLADSEGDRVNRYVSLLCAREVVRSVRSNYPDFASEHADDLAQLDLRLGATQDLRDAFEFGAADDRDQFFEWFEAMFFMTIKVPEASA